MATLQWLEDTAFSDWVLTSTIGFPLMLSLHAVGMAVAVGLILVLDLRLLGAFDVISYSFLRRALVLSWTGFTINFFSGLALFVPRGIEYVGDPAFLSKILLVTLGVATTARLAETAEPQVIGPGHRRAMVRRGNSWQVDHLLRLVA